MKKYFKICLVTAIVALSSIGFAETSDLPESEHYDLPDLPESEHYEECKEFADQLGSVYEAEFHGTIPADKYYSIINDCIEEKEIGDN